MSVLRIKQLVGLFAAWAVLAGVATIIALAATSVIATSTGADPGLAFTDPSMMAMDPPVTWLENDEADKLQPPMRAGIEVAWSDALTAMIVTSGEGDAALGSSLVEASFVSVSRELVQIRGSVAVARTIAGELVLTTEYFETTLVQQPSEWAVLSVQRQAS